MGGRGLSRLSTGIRQGGDIHLWSAMTRPSLPARVLNALRSYVAFTLRRVEQARREAREGAAEVRRG